MTIVWKPGVVVDILRKGELTWGLKKIVILVIILMIIVLTITLSKSSLEKGYDKTNKTYNLSESYTICYRQCALCFEPECVCELPPGKEIIDGEETINTIPCDELEGIN